MGFFVRSSLQIRAFVRFSDTLSAFLLSLPVALSLNSLSLTPAESYVCQPKSENSHKIRTRIFFFFLSELFFFDLVPVFFSALMSEPSSVVKCAQTHCPLFSCCPTLSQDEKKQGNVQHFACICVQTNGEGWRHSSNHICSRK